MSKWNTLKAAIANVIKTNGTQAITGSVLQSVLNNIVSSLGENYQFVGIATTSTNPGTPDGNVFYIAGEGTYVNFSNLTIGPGQIGILKWNGTWSKLDADIASYKKQSLYNVDANAPLQSDNYYTATTARAAIPTTVRKLGLIITYKTDATTSVTEQFVGSAVSAWATDANWKIVGSEGGNKIIEWDTDVATTRKKILAKERKKGMQISYEDAEGNWVNEQYIGTLLTDAEWIKDANWSKIAKEQSVIDLDSKFSKVVFRKTKFTKIDAAEKYENVNIVSNGRVDNSSTTDFYLFDASNISLDCALLGMNIYFTFTEKPTSVTPKAFLKNFKYNNVIDKALSIDSSVKYIGINVAKTVLDTSILFKDVSGTNFVKERDINRYINIEGVDSSFIPSGVARISKTKIFDVEAGQVYFVNKTSPVGMNQFVGLYKGEPSDETFIFGYSADNVRVVVPSEEGISYKLVVALENTPVSIGQNLKVLKIENINAPIINYLLSSPFADKNNDYYDLRKKITHLLKGSNQFVDYDFENNDPIAWNAKEIIPDFLTGSIPFIVSRGGGLPDGIGDKYALQDDGEGKHIFFTYGSLPQGGSIGFPQKYLREYSPNDTFIIGFLAFISSSSPMSFFGNNIIETNKWVWVEDEVTKKYEDYILYDFKSGRLGDTVKMKHFCLKNTTRDGSFVGFEVNESTYLKKTINSSNGADNLFANKNLVTIGDSLFLQLGNNNMPASIASKLKCNLLANFTKGGVGTIGTDTECGMMRAREIEDIKDEVDIIIYENVNDGGNSGSIEDEGFMLTQQVNVNVPSEKEADAYWDESFNEIVSKVTPKVGTMLRLAKGSEGFSIETSGTATSKGTISFIVGDMAVNIPVSVGDNAEKVMTAIDAYPFFDEGYKKDNDSSTSTKCVYINKTETETVVPKITNSTQGLSVVSAKSGGYSYKARIFHSHDVANWTNKEYWKTSISLYAQYKGLIEYFCTTCPQAWVFLMAGSRYYIAYTPEHISGGFASWEPPKRADGSYDIDAFQKSGTSYIRYDKDIPNIIREVCEYMHVNCIDLPRYNGINVYNASHYYKSCDVHIQYKKEGMDRWVDTIYRQMIGKG